MAEESAMHLRTYLIRSTPWETPSISPSCPSQVKGKINIFSFCEDMNLTAHSRIYSTFANLPHPPSQPRASLLKKSRRGGRTRRVLGWGIISQWRSEIPMRISGRYNQKYEEGAGWLDVSENGVAVTNKRGVH